jgi:hypothetical protein
MTVGSLFCAYSRNDTGHRPDLVALTLGVHGLIGAITLAEVNPVPEGLSDRTFEI